MTRPLLETLAIASLFLLPVIGPPTAYVLYLLGGGLALTMGIFFTMLTSFWATDKLLKL